jgi:Spy/CpxP family protein refolding chaperone
MKKSLTALGTLGAVLVGFVVLSGFGGGCGHHHPRDPAEVQAAVTAHLDEALDDLDATQAQRDQIHAIKDKLLAKGMALRADHQAVRDEVLAQWKSETPDRAKLHALVDQRIDALRAFAHDAVDAGADVHGILTPDQRAKVTKKIERHLQH